MDSNSITNFYNRTLTTEVNGAEVVLNIILAFALAMVIVWIWRRTHKSLSYSQSFAVTIVLLAPLASAVMMVVQNNIIGAFALIGAFSLIRFRTIMKETRDVAFLFFSLTIGVSVGTANYTIALITTFLVSGVILLLHYFNFGGREKFGFLLTLESDNKLTQVNLEPIFSKHLRDYELLHAKTDVEGNEFAYSVHFQQENGADEFLKDLRGLEGVSSSYLLTGKATIEY
jgi:hypothetical protein